MRVLVTGSNGLLGQELTLLLDRDQETQLIATARSKLHFSLTRGRFELLDVTNTESVHAVISKAWPDVVVHTAAMTQVDECETEREACWRNNVTAVENVVQACEKVKAHLIHISTDFIFDGTHGPLDESAKPNPINYYGESKLGGEKCVEKSGQPWAILRTVLLYGVPNGMNRSNIVLWVKKSLEEGKTIEVVDDQWRTPTLSDDLAMGCLLAARKKAKGIFHVSGDEMMTPYDVAVRTAAFFKLDGSLIKRTDSKHFTQPAKRPLKTGFIIEKAKRELGYAPRSFEEGLGVVAYQLSR